MCCLPISMLYYNSNNNNNNSVMTATISPISPSITTAITTTTTANTSSATLVAVCTSKIELNEFQFEKRQIPLVVDEFCPTVSYILIFFVFSF